MEIAISILGGMAAVVNFREGLIAFTEGFKSAVPEYRRECIRASVFYAVEGLFFGVVSVFMATLG